MDTSKFKPFSSEEIDNFIYANSRALQIPEEVYKSILETSLTQTQSDINDIVVAVSNQDFSKVQKLAHRIKGAYQNLRILSLGDLCLHIENIAKEQGDISELLICHDKLREIINSIKAYYNNAAT